ncbi:MAG TPA: hypothetical protein VL793_08220, partial [Patescibacteria group bacterium]|nr:hypothetical protein [Patescibacteria group bacterium]
MKIAVLFDHFGPYHRARLRAASGVCELLAIQARNRSRDYQWEPDAFPEQLHHFTLETSGRHFLPFLHFRRLQFVLEQDRP